MRIMNKLDDFVASEKIDDFVSDINPAQAYLDSLALSGRQSQDHALRVIAKMMGFEHWSEVPWADLDYRHTRKIRNLLKSSKYAPATINRTLSALKGVLKEAWRAGQMSEEQRARASDVGFVRGGNQDLAGRMLTIEEIVFFYRSCRDGTARGARDAAMFAMLRVGLRREEVVGLKISDIDFFVQTLKVAGKGAKTRIVPLAGDIWNGLNEWLQIRGMKEGYLFNPIRRDGIIIPRRLHPNTLYRMLRERQERLGMRRFTPHDLRRTMISELLEFTDISTVQGLAGHSNTSQTAKYDRRPDRARREAVEKLALYDE
jgi:integrase